MPPSHPVPGAMARRSFLSSTARGLVGAAYAGVMGGRAFAQDACGRLDAMSDKWDAHVRPMLATRYHRLHHCIYHYVRNNWAGLSPEQTSAISALKWNVARPALVRAAWAKDLPYSSAFWATSNGSGEDFLYFHRWMIAMVDRMLAAEGAGAIEPWSGDNLPSPQGGCEDEQVPDFLPVFENPDDPKRPIQITSLQLRVIQTKAPGFFWGRMNWWGQEFRDPAALAKMTLGELGSRLESSVHNQMHIRWSGYPTNGWRLVRDESDFRAKWDDPGYDTLFDEYASHLHPLFFRLHKWVDNRIEDWAEAHGADVTRMKTPYGFDWFNTGRFVQVAAPWTGAWGFQPVGAAEEKARVAVMEDVAKVLFPPPDVKNRFTATDQEQHEREQRRVLSIRDLIG